MEHVICSEINICIYIFLGGRKKGAANLNPQKSVSQVSEVLETVSYGLCYAGAQLRKSKWSIASLTVYEFSYPVHLQERGEGLAA